MDTLPNMSGSARDLTEDIARITEAQQFAHEVTRHMRPATIEVGALVDLVDPNWTVTAVNGDRVSVERVHPAGHVERRDLPAHAVTPSA